LRDNDDLYSDYRTKSRPELLIPKEIPKLLHNKRDDDKNMTVLKTDLGLEKRIDPRSQSAAPD
jgi:hypothetical protein